MDTFERMCGQGTAFAKRAYPTLTLALNERDRIIKNQGKIRRPYVCPYCQSYHLTSKPMTPKQKLANEHERRRHLLQSAEKPQARKIHKFCNGRYEGTI